MKALKISKTPYSPEVILDKKQNVFKITGDLLPENSFSFFEPIINWFEEYSKEPLDYTKLQLSFNVINTSSTRKIILVMRILDRIAQTGKIVKVVIYHLSEDEMMEYWGHELTQLFPKLNIVMKTKLE